MSPELARLNAISDRLQGIRGTIKRLFLMDGLARLLLAAGAFIVATFILDYFLILPQAIRLLFLVAGLAGLSWIAARRVVYPLGVKISDDDLAIFVERHYPELKDRLISALQLARNADTSERGAGFNSPQLVDALITDATEAASALDFNRVVVRTHVHKIALWGGLLLLALAGFAAYRPDLAYIFIIRDLMGGTKKWPQRTNLTVQGFTNNLKVVARGDDLTIAVSADGQKPSKVRMNYRFDTGERGRETLGENMVEGGKSVWTFTMVRVSGNFTFTVEGNDDVTDEMRVETRNPPAIEEMKIYLDFPDYLGWDDTPADRPETNPNLQVPLYTGVSFVAVCNEHLEKVTLKVGAKEGGKTETLLLENDEKGVRRIAKGRFMVEDTFLEYQITLEAANGLQNRDPLIYTVKASPDMKPQVTVHDPPGDETATEICERPIVIETKDDHGLREISVEVKVVGAKSTDWQRTVLTKDHNRPPDYGPRQDRIRSEYLLKISELGVKPGEFVIMRIRAEDFKNVGGGTNSITSKDYRFTIVQITVLEKELQDAIDKIKQTLEALKRRQNSLYDRVGGLDKKLRDVDQRLSSEQSGEVKSAALEQNDITSKLDGCRKDIERVMRRGLYNKIFDENAANELGKGVTILKNLADTSDPARPGVSAVAAGFVTQAAKATKSKDRRDQFSEAQSQQNAVIKGIQDALRFLDRWSNYQEIVRMTREILELQKDVNKGLLDKEKDK